MASTPPLPNVFIVGGGFAGLAAAKALAKGPCRVSVIDRRNYHVFQPLLYQVATAALSPADITAPIRTILRDQRNCQVALAVLGNWFWEWLLNSRDARLITGDATLTIEIPRPPAFVADQGPASLAQREKPVDAPPPSERIGRP